MHPVEDLGLLGNFPPGRRTDLSPLFVPALGATQDLARRAERVGERFEGGTGKRPQELPIRRDYHDPFRFREGYKDAGLSL